MSRSFASVISLPLIAVAGAVVSGGLLSIHVSNESVFAAACGDGGSGCDRVLGSRWSVLPPAPEGSAPHGAQSPSRKGADEESASDDDEPSVPRVPVAAVGLIYFSTFAVWFTAIGVPGWRRRWLHWLVFLACMLGCFGSAAYIVIMFQMIGSACWFCLAAHGVNFILLFALLVVRPQPGAAEVEALFHPGPRLVLVTLALAATVGVAEMAFYQSALHARHAEELAEQLDVLDPDEEILRVIYLNQKRVDLKIEDSDPMVRNEKQPRMTLAYFSNAECPSCAKFEKFLFEEIKPLFNGHLRIVYKHLPLEKTLPNSYRAATALQAAHAQGKFWEAHDYLVARRTQLANLNYSVMAEEFDLNKSHFETDMRSTDTEKRIRKDMELARSLGITSTPTVYLNGRPVNRALRAYLGFWKERAESLKRYAEDKGLTW